MEKPEIVSRQGIRSASFPKWHKAAFLVSRSGRCYRHENYTLGTGQLVLNQEMEVFVLSHARPYHLCFFFPDRSLYCHAKLGDWDTDYIFQSGHTENLWPYLVHRPLILSLFSNLFVFDRAPQGFILSFVFSVGSLTYLEPDASTCSYSRWRSVRLSIQDSLHVSSVSSSKFW